MKKTYLILFCSLVLLAGVAPLYAQSGGVDPSIGGGGGCVDSPENPTAILALAGSAGAGIAALRTRLKRTKKK